MKKQIEQAVKNSKNLDQVKKALFKLFQETKQKQPSGKIGYVGGIIFSDGLEHVETNLKKLSDHTEEIREKENFAIFSSTDIFYKGLYQQLDEAAYAYEKKREIFIQFWRDIVGSGYVTDIFMTPRWELSEGARDEHETAKTKGLEIHYLDDLKMKKKSKKIITICSSASFYKEVIEIEKQLKKLGFTVKIPNTANIMKKTGNFNVADYKTWYTNKNDYKKKTALMDAHFKKVLAADAILVVNNEKHAIPGYIGGNVLMEMTLAYHYKKPIYLWNDVNSKLSIEEEVRGVNPIIIEQDIKKIIIN